MEIERVETSNYITIMNKKIIKTELFFYIAFLFACIFVLLQSPLAPFAKSSNGVDSSVFIYAARQILKGQIMYKDIVDHKGPFLYLINVAALFIFNGKFVGIWIFEIISLFTASIMMYKTARFFADKIPSFFAVVTAILFIVQLLIGGNFTEEWALPFISIAMYIFIACLKENKPFGIVRLLILSLTFVLTLMLQANLTAIWASFGIVFLIKWTIETKYKELIRSALFVLLFVLLSILPFFLYFYFKGALSDAIYLAFKYNMFEYEPVPITLVLKRAIKGLAGLYYMSVIPFAIVIYMFLREKTIINGSVLLAFVFTALVCSLGRLYQVYYIIFVPLLVIPYSYMFAVIKNSFSKAKYALLSLFILFVFYNYIPAILQAQYVVENYSEKGYGSFVVPPSTMKVLKEIIIRNTKPEDEILVRGNQVSLYLYSGRSCATRFPFVIERTYLTKDYYVKEAKEALPKLIVQGKLVLTRDSLNLDSLLNEKYRLIPTGIENIEIWKLKENQ